MALSVQVAREFVKTVQSLQAATPTTQVKGTIVTNNGDKYVQLDGSTQLTPISSTTTGLTDGDRVLVSVNDHKSTIIGNTTSPSVSSADLSRTVAEIDTLLAKKIDADQLEADLATINQLVSDKATIDKLKSGEITVKDLLADQVSAGTISANTAEFVNMAASSANFTTLVAGYISAKEIDAAKATITDLVADTETVKELQAGTATIDSLIAKKLEAGEIDADVASIITLNAKNADLQNLSAEKLNAIFANIGTAQIDAASVTGLDAIVAKIVDLDTSSATITNLNNKYAEIDFANIGEVSIRNLYAKSGVIQDLDIKDGVVTGTLGAVTINADNIKTGTLTADRINLLGDDGLYYRLNTQGVGLKETKTDYSTVCKVDEEAAVGAYPATITTDPDTGKLVLNVNCASAYSYQWQYSSDEGATWKDLSGVTTQSATINSSTTHKNAQWRCCMVFDQNETNSLNGSLIMAKTIGAEQITVSDLVAFGAKIGGMNLADGMLYSGSKGGAESEQTGFYLDQDGQVAIGDADNYIKFHKVADKSGAETWKLDISTESLAALITDAAGNSMMTKGENGQWTFNFSKVTDLVDASKEDVAELEKQVNNLIENTSKDGVSYITMGTAQETNDAGEVEEVPCIQLGKDGENLSLKITDRSINFMQGDEKVAYMTGQLFHIRSGVLTEELHLGEQTSTTGSWVWKKRPSEHLGLRYAKPLSD